MKFADGVATAFSSDGNKVSVPALKVRLSPFRLFSVQDEPARKCLKILGAKLASREHLVILGAGSLTQLLLDAYPRLRNRAVVAALPGETALIEGARPLDQLEIGTKEHVYFLSHASWTKRAALRHLVPQNAEILEPDMLAALAPQALPSRAWIAQACSPYPMDIPAIEFRANADIVLLDCPGRNLGMMPNGLAYVHAALTGAGIAVSTLDLDIIVYHRYHAHRLLDLGQEVRLADGRTAPEDPWAAEQCGWWSDAAFVEMFRPEMGETLEALVRANPKVLGVSVHECNTLFTRKLVKRLRERCPDTVVLAGGYSCNQADVGLRAFPECDFMCIGEADLTAPELVKALLRGERPTDMPGVLSRGDSLFRVFEPGSIPMDLDALPRPAYPWVSDLFVYTNHDFYRLTPVIASRGCRWSKCRFCGECIPWRARDPVLFVDEMQELYEQGRELFMFNESDFNGSHKLVRAICEEIIRRDLKVRLTGQLRIDRKSTAEFFVLLKRAGFVSVRFGVDAWSANTLRIQNKGYTTDIIRQNLRDCHAAGIHCEVNVVIGVPGETESDLDESVALLLDNRENIDRIANTNPLMLVVGSAFWREPERYGIRFKEDKLDIMQRYPHAIPAHLWYSEDPFIDDAVRTSRFKRFLSRLSEAGFPMSDFAKKILTDVSEGTDSVRAGGATQGAQKEGEPQAPAAGCCTQVDIPKMQSILDAGQSQTFSEVAGPLFMYGSEVWAVTGGASLPASRPDPRLLKQGLASALQALLGLGAKPHESLPLWLEKQPEQVRRVIADSEVQMIRSDVFGFNLLEVRGEYFALRHGVPFDYHNAVNDLYSYGECLRASSVFALNQAIAAIFPNIGLPTKLVKPNVKCFNIVEAGGIYYAIRQGLSFNSYKADTGGYESSDCFRGSSLAVLESTIRDCCK